MKKKRILLLFLVLSVVIPITVNFALPVAAAGGGTTDIGSMNALDALGIDTSEMPEGVDLDSTDNPYGRDTVTVNPVYELFVQKPADSVLHGHNKKVGGTWEQFFKSDSTGYVPGDTKNLVITGDYAATATAAGNFTKDSGGKKGQTVTVAAGALDANGGLYLYFSDPVSNVKSGAAKELLKTTEIIGNTGNQMNEDFSADAYLMQNYLRIVTGDFDGDGVDEVAVYVPQQGSSRVEIYDLQIGSDFKEGDADTYFLDSSRWAKAWTYYFNESPYVSNMVSLTDGDFNRDGTDDLALTWGFYYGHTKFSNSKAIILYGSETSMLQKSKAIGLTYDNTQIVRAAFTYGDIDGDNVNDLILGGQLNRDISSGNLYSRFVAVYTYNGDEDVFIQSIAQNFDLFAKERNDAGENVYVHPVMAKHNNIFYSLPTMVANISAVNMRGAGYASNIYIDSLVIEYGDNGLEIIAALDQDIRFNKHALYMYLTWIRAYPTGRFYTEYGVVSGDFTGSSAQSLQIMMYYSQEYYERKTQYSVPYYQNWWNWLFGIQSYYVEKSEEALSLPLEVEMIALKGELIEEKQEGVVTGYNFDIKTQRTTVGFATSFCKLNSDNDTSYISYTGEHGVVYSDPKVLAVLASAPYFEDLSSDELSGSYMESSTGYSSSTGTGSEKTTSHTLSIGAYVSFEHDFEVLGVKVAGMETEFSYTCGLTWETTKSSMMEMTVSYETVAGQDSVAFYSIPMEYYVYDSYVPVINETTGEVIRYDKQKMSVNLPHTAAVVVLPLEKYEKIAADYKELPQIAGTVLAHAVGNPSTYPGSSAGYANAIEYSGDWAGVDYSASGAGITQEIAVTEENSSGFSHSHALEFKIGAGPGDFIFGISLGYEYGSSKVNVTSVGSTYSGTIYNMPAEAEEYGYYYAWKLFTYTYNVQGINVPVVNYMVKDVTQPPLLPKDFEQDSSLTTDDSIGLTWSYPSATAISGFQIYRYYMFPDGSGSYELAFVPASDVDYVTMDSDNKLIRHYKYIDEALADYTDYDYQIQTVRAGVPTLSILSDVLTARTKADKGYPTITLNGVDEIIEDVLDEETGEVIGSVTNYSLRVYPDTKSIVSVSVQESYDQTPRYQWQKLTDEGWEDIKGATKEKYTFSSSGVSVEGEYRCRLNVIYEDEQVGQIYYISAYSDIFAVNYSMRKPELVDGSFVVDILNKTVSLELKSGHTAHTFAPSGNVTFVMKGADYESVYTVALGSPDDNYRTRAILDLGATDRDNDHICANLPDGVYEITAYYSGSRVFGSLSVTNPIYYVSGGGSGYLLNMDSSFIYGDTITPKLMDIRIEGASVKATETTTGVTYKAYKETPVIHEINFTVPYKFFGQFMWNRTYTYRYITYEYIESPDFIRPDGSVTARNAGKYKLKAYVNDNEVAIRDIIVEQKNITIGFEHSLTGVAGNAGITQPTYSILKVIPEDGLVDICGDTLENLGLVVKAYNTAGTEVALSPDTNPGLYTIIGAAGTPSENYINYNITYMPSTYILTGPKYDMTIECAPYGSDNVIAGTVAIISPEIKADDGTIVNMATTATDNSWYGDDVFTGGTGIVLRAKPQTGYKVKSWTVEAGTKSEITETSATTFAYQTTADDTVITVKYEIAKNKLYFKSANNLIGDGTVTAVGNAIQSGAVAQPGARYTFFATPAVGYHFVEWTLTGSTNSNFTGDYDEENGTSTTELIMGNIDTVLSAVFKRDNYILALQSNLQAEYEADDGFGVMVPKTSIGSVSIPGDTSVKVVPRKGYSLVDDPTWYVNGTSVGTGLASYTFTIKADTTIDVGTSQNTYDVSVMVSQPELTVNNKVIAKINNAVADFSETRTVSGGSTLTFTAVPAWGYVFDCWKVNDAVSGTAGKILTIAALGETTSVEAVFVQNPNSYTINVSNNPGGELSYSVIYNEQGYSGNAPEDASVVANGTDITVYKGDTVVFTANPSPNYMLRSWTVGNDVDESPEMSLTLEDISGNITVSARFIAMSFTTVTYSVDGGGSILSAKSNGNSFSSGDVVGNGTKVVIVAEPNADNMINKWTIDGEDVKTDDNTTFVGETLIIEKLAAGSTTEIKVYFTALSQYTVNYNLTNVTVNKIYTPVSYKGKTPSTATTDYVIDGTKMTITAEPASGYRITQFTVDGKSGTENEDGTWSYTLNQVTSDINVVAAAQKLYTISIDADIENGSIVIATEKEEGQAIAGETITLKEINPDVDYTFGGWSYNGTEVTGTTFIMPAADITVSADFIQIDSVDIIYSVYDTNDAEEGGTNGTISAVVSRIDDMGQSLNGYPYIDSDGSITVNRGYSDSYVEWPNSVITFKAKPDNGYMTKCWYLDDVEVAEDTPDCEIGLNSLKFTVTEDANDGYDIKVQYDVIGDKIIYSAANAYGTITSSVLTNEYDEETQISSGDILTTNGIITFTAKPINNDYKVEGWYVNGIRQNGENGTTYQYEATAGIGAIVVVNFERVSYSVEYNGEGGTVIAEINDISIGDSPADVVGDSIVKFTAESYPGYAFGTWKVNSKTNSESSNILALCITKNTTVTAVFQESENCTVTYEVTGIGGILTAARSGRQFNSGSFAAANDVITFTAKPDTVAKGGANNYRVVSWNVNGKVTETNDTTYKLTVKADTSISVSFERTDYVVDYGTNGKEKGSLRAKSNLIDVKNLDRVVKGGSVTFTATPASGYQVKSWTVDGVTTETENKTYTISNLLADTVVRVEFEKAPAYTVTINVGGTGYGTVNARFDGTADILNVTHIEVPNHGKITLTAVRYDANNAFNGWTVPTDAACTAEASGTALILSDVMGDITVGAAFTPAAMIQLSASENDEHGTLAFKEVQVGYISAGLMKKVDLSASAGIQITKGMDAVIKAVPDNDYMVDKWIVNGVEKNELSKTLTLKELSEDAQIGVTFEPLVQYSIPAAGTQTNGGYYTVTPGLKIPDDVGSETQIRDRGTVTFTVKANNGCYFTDLKVFDVDCLKQTGSPQETTENIVSVAVGKNSSYTITVANVKGVIGYTIRAVKPVINITEPANGTIAVTYLDGSNNKNAVATGSEIPVGTKLTVTATSNAGYYLKQWGNDVALQNGEEIYIVVTQKESITISAEFAQPVVTVLVPAKGAIVVNSTDGNGNITELADTSKAEDVDRLTFIVPVGTELNITAIPDKGYTLKSWGGAAAKKRGTPITIAVPGNDIAISASFNIPNVEGGGAGGSGGAGGGSIFVPTSNPQPGSGGITSHVATNNDGTTTVTTTVTTNVTVSGNTGATSLNDSMAENIIAQFRAAQQQASSDTVDNNIIINSTTGNQVTQTTVQMPNSALSSIAGETSATMTIATDTAEVTLDQTALSTIAHGTTGGTVAFKVEKVDTTKLPEDVQKEIGDAYVLDLTVEGENGKVSDFAGGTATVRIPVPQDKIGKEMKVLFIADDGTMEEVTGHVVTINGVEYYEFVTGHFSYYALIEDTSLCFADVSEDDWYYEPVAYVYGKGLMTGTSSSKFEPSATTTRAMIVTVLWRLNGSKDASTNGFADVPAKEWYSNAVSWAAENGVVKGIGGELFAPNANITREQMAVILYNYAVFMGYDVSMSYDITQFTDSKGTSSWATEAMKWAVAQKIISGKTGRMLDAIGTATRAEVATILMRFIENVTK